MNGAPGFFKAHGLDDIIGIRHIKMSKEPLKIQYSTDIGFVQQN